MAALHDLEPEAWDALESLGEWRVFTGQPSDDEYWLNLARYITAPIPPEKEEVEF